MSMLLDLFTTDNGNAAPRKIDRKMSEGGPIFRRYGLQDIRTLRSVVLAWMSARSRQQSLCQSSAVPAD